MNAFPMWARKSRMVRVSGVYWTALAAGMWLLAGMPVPALWVVWLLTGCLVATVLVPVLAVDTRHVTEARSAMVTGTAAVATIAAGWRVSTGLVIAAAVTVGICLLWVVDAIRTGRREWKDRCTRAAVVDAVRRLAGE